MPATPALSVIVPHLDAPEELDRCLQALDGQRNDGIAFEVIVVDNGSSRRPDTVCATYDFVRLTEEPTPGPGPARSHGARLAQAGLLAFIDCDCVAQSGWITGIVEHFETHPETQVIGGDVRIRRADPGRTTAIEAYEAVYGYRMQLYIARDHYAATCNMAVRRDSFARVGDFAGIRIAEDVDWGRRAHAIGIGIDYLPQIRIATPARSNFGELARKWDRHIGHDHAEVTGPGGHLRWILRALMLAASPLGETLRIARSDRLEGLSERLLAFACLTRIRLYRCRRMLGLLVGGDGKTVTGAWRRRG